MRNARETISFQHAVWCHKPPTYLKRIHFDEWLFKGSRPPPCLDRWAQKKFLHISSIQSYQVLSNVFGIAAMVKFFSRITRFTYIQFTCNLKLFEGAVKTFELKGTLDLLTRRTVILFFSLISCLNSIAFFTWFQTGRTFFKQPNQIGKSCSPRNSAVLYKAHILEMGVEGENGLIGAI